MVFFVCVVPGCQIRRARTQKEKRTKRENKKYLHYIRRDKNKYGR
jgi:hypothetical protein